MPPENDNLHRFFFSKKERISSKITFQALIKQNNTFFAYPLKCYYIMLQDNQSTCHQMGVSVSKRRFKKAVDRNRIKRLVKEAYRLQKHLLPSQTDISPNKNLATLWVYVGNEIVAYANIEAQMKLLLKKLHDQFSAQS